MRTRTLHALLVGTLALAACDADLATSPADSGLSPDATSSSLTTVPGVQEVVGETGPGSTYALFRPADWNGELVVYAHGYVQPFFEPTLPVEFDGIRDGLLLQRYAVAYSSYSETGYAVKDGAQRTHQLNGLFADAFGEPSRTYLVGTSLGGLVAEMLSERFASQYDGTLALCGAVAGGAFNAAYVAHFRVLFDVFYPGVLAGSLYEIPDGYIVAGPPAGSPPGTPGSPAYNAILGALLANPLPAMEMAAIEQIGLEYQGIGELISSFIQVLGYQVNGANALTETLHGHGFFDNADTRYTGSSDDDALNAAVARFSADPAAANYMAHWWQPEGRIERPFVTLHTTRDPLVPRRGEDRFAGTVAAAGRGDLLLQLETEAFGHCAFQPADIAGALGALLQWVATGVRPAV